MPFDLNSIKRQYADKLLLKNILRKIFFEDWATKLVALGITMALWYGVTGLSTPVTTRMHGIPIALRYSGDVEVTNSPIQKADVIISGDKRRIDQIRDELIISVDLSALTPGDRVIDLRADADYVRIDVPNGVKVEDIQPGKIAIRLEPVEEKELAVKLSTVGEIPKGFEIYDETIRPTIIKARGPASIINPVKEVVTEIVDIDGRREDFTLRQVQLNTSHSRITLQEPTVEVTFRIGESRMERVFLVPVNDESGRRATVVLYGPRSILLAITPMSLVVNLRQNDNGNEIPVVELNDELKRTVEVKDVKVS